MKHRTLDQWIKLSRSYVAGGTAEQHAAIGKLAHETGCGVWHAAFIVGKKKKCMCGPCHEASKEV